MEHADKLRLKHLGLWTSKPTGSGLDIEGRGLRNTQWATQWGHLCAHFTERNWGILGPIQTILHPHYPMFHPIPTLKPPKTPNCNLDTTSRHSEEHMDMARVGTPSHTAPKVGRYLWELGRPPLTMQEERLTKGATTPPTDLWNAPHKAAPACDLESMIAATQPMCVVLCDLCAQCAHSTQYAPNGLQQSGPPTHHRICNAHAR